jgi:alkylhydroperoxidase family enzyme
MKKCMIIIAAMLGVVAAGPLHAEEGNQEKKMSVEEQKVSRLPPLPQPFDPIMQEMFANSRAKGGAVINLNIATGHAPKFAQASRAMAFAIRFDAKTPRKLLELVIMRTAQIVGSAYELNQHTPFIKACGYSDAQIAAIPAWQASTLFDDKERALLGYVEQVAHGGEVDDATFATLAKFFTPEEIVEITYTVGSYYSTGLLTKALRIEVETDGRITVAGKC